MSISKKVLLQWASETPKRESKVLLSNVLAFNVFDDKNLEVKHPASKVWATNIIGVKELESIEQYHFRTFFENFNFIC